MSMPCSGKWVAFVALSVIVLAAVTASRAAEPQKVRVELRMVKLTAPTATSFRFKDATKRLPPVGLDNALRAAVQNAGGGVLETLFSRVAIAKEGEPVAMSFEEAGGTVSQQVTITVGAMQEASQVEDGVKVSVRGRYVDYNAIATIKLLQEIGPGTHCGWLCQESSPVYVAGQVADGKRTLSDGSVVPDQWAQVLLLEVTSAPTQGVN
jgi:hypothetical protein